MAPRTQGVLLGVLVGAAIAVAAGLVVKEVTGLGLRDRMWGFQEDATAAFLDVPPATLHLRAVPSRGAFMPGDVSTPGTMDTLGDAVHEFFREDERTWSVHLFELAVPAPGTLTVEVVDRPAPDGTARETVARLGVSAAPGRAHLVGFGVMDGAFVSFPAGYGRDPPAPASSEEPAAGSPLRLRLLAAGGRPADDPVGDVRSRAFTTVLTPSAWGDAHTLDRTLPPASSASLEGLRWTWVAGPDLPARGHVSGCADGPGLLGVIVWSPKESRRKVHGRHGSWRDGVIHEEHLLGDVVVTRTNHEITLAVDDVPTPLERYPYPAWVLRTRFDPAP